MRILLAEDEPELGMPGSGATAVLLGVLGKRKQKLAPETLA